MRLARPVLLLWPLIVGSLSAPAASQEPRAPPLEQISSFKLEQNYPNPVSPETWIPFTLEEPLFQDGEAGKVSIRIYNVLRQLVAIPKAVEHPKAKNAPVLNLTYSEAGPQVAYWDGKDTAGRPVPTGVYYCQMIVNDLEPQTRKLIVVNPRKRRNIFPWFRSRSR